MKTRTKGHPEALGDALTAVLLVSVLSVACPGRQAEGARTADNTTESTDSSMEHSASLDSEDEDSPNEGENHPVCVGYRNETVDPLQRWLQAFPIERGGVVFVFIGPSAQPMEVEVALEMASIVGYEDFSCGTAVVVWVPSMECEGRELDFAQRVEEETTMMHSETICFRLDEVTARFREECERGTVPADRCP